MHVATNIANFEQNIYSVDQVSEQILNLIQSNFYRVQIRGEVSNSKLSGNWYFSLKDSKINAQYILDAVIWKSKFASIVVKPQDGMEIICTGRITVYKSRSKYQLDVDHIELAGHGVLLKLFEELKHKLAEEGLFKLERKKALPFLPRSIGIVTSATGSAIQDILHRIKNRFPCPVLLWSVAVQGKGAAEQIAAAIYGFNNLPKNFSHPIPDLLIVARGGGSLEDLWAFNEEVVIRAIAASNIPIISGVGHETETTLTDLVADYRAPTPTAAAEKAVPVRGDLAKQLLQIAPRLERYFERNFNYYNQELEMNYVKFERIQMAYFDNQYQRFKDLNQKLCHPRDKIAQSEFLVGHANRKLNHAVGSMMNIFKTRLIEQSNFLQSYSYEAILERGFALVKGTDGRLIKSKDDCHSHDGINVTFYDGEVRARVI